MASAELLSPDAPKTTDDLQQVLLREQWEEAEQRLSCVLQEKIYLFDGSSYHAFRTAGGGDCAMHALCGEPHQGFIQCPSARLKIQETFSVGWTSLTDDLQHCPEMQAVLEFVKSSLIQNALQSEAAAEVFAPDSDGAEARLMCEAAVGEDSWVLQIAAMQRQTQNERRDSQDQLRSQLAVASRLLFTSVSWESLRAIGMRLGCSL